VIFSWWLLRISSGVDDYEEKFRDVYNCGEMKLDSGQVFQSVYDLNECHLVAEDMSFLCKFYT